MLLMLKKKVLLLLFVDADEIRFEPPIREVHKCAGNTRRDIPFGTVSDRTCKSRNLSSEEEISELKDLILKKV